MPTLSRDEFHITLTDSHGLADDTIEKAIEYFKTTTSKHFIVEEYGNSGNPHLHVYVKYEKKKRADTLKKSIITHVYPFKDINKKAIAIKKVDDVRALIGGYMIKESCHRQHSIHGIDLEEAKDYAEKFYASRKVKQKGIGLLNAHHAMNKYCLENELMITDWIQFKEVFVHMVQNGFNMLLITGKAYLVFSHYMATYSGNKTFLLDRLEGSRNITLNKENMDFN